MRKQLIAGNWKMNHRRAETEAFIAALREKLVGVSGVDVAIAPPFPYLAIAADKLAGSSIGLSAQNAYWENSGAFTGEVSAPMLKDVGCQYVIVGHSERRQLFDETDDTVQKRIIAALAAGLTPIVCVGETLADREAGNTMPVVMGQLLGAIGGLSAADHKRLVFAYEPVWAIGTGRVATPAQAQEVHAYIRDILKKGSPDVAAGARLLYGGSVKSDNARDLLAQPDIDGALVGGASLKADEFTRIILSARGVQATV